MDYKLAAAITAVPLDETKAPTWFQIICEEYQAESNDWEAYLEKVKARAGMDYGSDAVQLLREALEPNGGFDTVKELAQNTPEEIAAAYAELSQGHAKAG